MRRTFVIIFIFIIAVMNSSIFSQGTETKKEAKANIPAGFGDLTWGTPIVQAKDKVIGKIVFFDEKRKVITRDGDIEYLYGFFYVDPAVAAPEGAESSETKEKQDAAENASNASLFYVSVQFPYLAKEDVIKKIEEKYGPPTGEDLKDNQGAIIWDSEKTTIVLWVDRYEDKPFCKKINYVGKELAGKINEYQKQVFNKKEIDILKRLSL